MIWNIKINIHAIKELTEKFDGSILCGGISDYYYGITNSPFLNDIDIMTRDSNTAALEKYKISLNIAEKESSFSPIVLHQGLFKHRKFDLFINQNAEFIDANLHGYAFRIETPQFRLSMLQFCLNMPDTNIFEEWKIKWLNKQKNKAKIFIPKYQKIIDFN